MSEHHSADVRITLHLAGEDLAVSHLGPDYLRLRGQGPHCCTCQAEITLSIDGQARRWPVRLPDGIHEGKVRVEA